MLRLKLLAFGNLFFALALVAVWIVAIFVPNGMTTFDLVVFGGMTVLVGLSAISALRALRTGETSWGRWPRRNRQPMTNGSPG